MTKECTREGKERRKEVLLEWPDRPTEKETHRKYIWTTRKERKGRMTIEQQTTSRSKEKRELKHLFFLFLPLLTLLKTIDH